MFIDFQGIINARELGGMTSEDGRKVKKNCLLRCGELEKATDEDIRRLQEAFGIRYIIDLRDPLEAEERPDRDVPGAVYVSLPALPPMEQPKDRIKNGPQSDIMDMFPQIYRELAESPESIAAYRRFIRLLVEGEGAPVLWHCRQGKDRTGIAAILLLHLLGVPREECIREYLLTNRFMQPRFDAYLSKEKEAWKIDMMKLISFVREDWLAEYWTIIDERFGGLDNYLQDILLITEEDRSKLRSYYLE